MTPFPSPLPIYLPQPDNSIIPNLIAFINLLVVIYIFASSSSNRKKEKLADSKVDWFKNTIINNLNNVDIFFNGLKHIYTSTNKNDTYESYIDNVANQYSILLNDFIDDFCTYINVMDYGSNIEIIDFSDNLEYEFLYLSGKSFYIDSSDVIECINKYQSAFLKSIYTFMTSSQFKINI